MNELQSMISSYLEFCKNQKRLDPKTLKAYRIDLSQLSSQITVTEISSVTLELGEVSTVIEKYLYDVWKWAVLKKSEHMKDSKLIVETIPAITYCESCGAKYGTVKHGKICPECGSGHTYLLQGNEFNIKEIEGC